MRLIETGRCHLLIEHEDEIYRLGGELFWHEFSARKSWIKRQVGEERVDVLSEEEADRVIYLVEKYWHNDDLTIEFVDDDLNFICSTRKAKENFTVSRRWKIFMLSLFWSMCFVVAMIFYTVLVESPHPAVYIVVTLTVFLPCAILMLRERLFKITVNGRRVMVRGYMGVKYSFDLSEIEELEWKIDVTDPFKSTLTIKTASKRVLISTTCKGMDDLRLLLLENVDRSKINSIIVHPIKFEREQDL